MWDLGGQSSIRPYWRCYYPNTDAIIFVVDSTDTERLETARVELHTMLAVRHLAHAPAPARAWCPCAARIYLPPRCRRFPLSVPLSLSSLSSAQEADLEKSVLLVFANKQDMAGALNAAQIGEALGLASIKDRQWSIQETSAAAGKGLHEGFDFLAQAIQKLPSK